MIPYPFCICCCSFLFFFSLFFPWCLFCFVFDVVVAVVVLLIFNCSFLLVFKSVKDRISNNEYCLLLHVNSFLVKMLSRVLKPYVSSKK